MVAWSDAGTRPVPSTAPVPTRKDNSIAPWSGMPGSRITRTEVAPAGNSTRPATASHTGLTPRDGAGRRSIEVSMTASFVRSPWVERAEWVIGSADIDGGRSVAAKAHFVFGGGSPGLAAQHQHGDGDGSDDQQQAGRVGNVNTARER